MHLHILIPFTLLAGALASTSLTEKGPHDVNCKGANAGNDINIETGDCVIYQPKHGAQIFVDFGGLFVNYDIDVFSDNNCKDYAADTLSIKTVYNNDYQDVYDDMHTTCVNMSTVGWADWNSVRIGAIV